MQREKKSNNLWYSSGWVRKFKKLAQKVNDDDPDIKNTLISHQCTVKNTSSIVEVKTNFFSDMLLKEKLNRINLDASLAVIHKKTLKTS